MNAEDVKGKLSEKDIAEIILISAMLFMMPVQASTVLSIGDGDTITITENSQRIKVRLACIDASETSQSPFGMEAKITPHLTTWIRCLSILMIC